MNVFCKLIILIWMWIIVGDAMTVGYLARVFFRTKRLDPKNKTLFDEVMSVLTDYADETEDGSLIDSLITIGLLWPMAVAVLLVIVEPKYESIEKEYKNGIRKKAL